LRQLGCVYKFLVCAYALVHVCDLFQFLKQLITFIKLGKNIMPLELLECCIFAYVIMWKLYFTNPIKSCNL